MVVTNVRLTQVHKLHGLLDPVVVSRCHPRQDVPGPKQKHMIIVPRNVAIPTARLFVIQPRPTTAVQLLRYVECFGFGLTSSMKATADL